MKYKLDFRSINPSKGYREGKHIYIHGFNSNGLKNADEKTKEELGDGFPKEGQSAGKYNFIIKPYQRGFRWDAKENVRKLLDDLFKYSDNLSNDMSTWTSIEGSDIPNFNDFDFYCLQTLTVKQEESIGNWEVIDGQQRLMCIFMIYELLFAFLESTVYTPYSITYQRESENFLFSDVIKDCLNSLEEKPYGILDKIENDAGFDSDNWFSSFKIALRTSINTSVEKQARESYQVDSYYIKTAMSEIADFIQKTSKAKLSKLFECIKRNVYFLWYEVPQEERGENVFLRINSGAIPLTNAELVKSLLLRKENDEDDVKLKSRIWESMECGLNNDELWSFIAGSYASSTRIDLLLEVYALENGYTYQTKANNEYALFDWFCKHLAGTSSENVIKGIQDVFDRLYEWYDDVEIYHYIGMLSILNNLGFTFDKYQSQSEMLKILLAGKQPSKCAFISILKKDTIACLKSKLTKEQKDLYKDSIVPILSADFLNYDDNKKLIMAILWLHNVVETINSADNRSDMGTDLRYKDYVCRRFPFSEFLSGQWSAEHIFPQHPEDKDVEGKKQYDQATEGIKTGKITEDNIHYINNLALLRSKDNAALQNKMLDAKRTKIIELLGEGAYVPNSTVNAFFLYYNAYKNDSSEPCTNNQAGNNWLYWTEENANNYLKALEGTLAFLEKEGK